MTVGTVLIMAGGTGGHIFPGLAIAQELRTRGWRVHWLGQPTGMEAGIASQHGFPLEPVSFSGVRGRGLATLIGLPVRLLRACRQAWGIIRRVKPDVVVGMGGYITFPGGLMAVLAGKPLILHEQNAIAGRANTLLCAMADRVFTAFPHVLKRGQWIGNPLRSEFTQQAEPAERFARRDCTGERLRLLVVGGSLGAKALNETVPQALALLPPEKRPTVTHQSGAMHLEMLRSHYQAAGVSATLLPFIEDMAAAYAEADVIVCRAGAGTVTEIAAVGAAAVFVPYPYAVDDHQSANARWLVSSNAAWLLLQREFTPNKLADLLQNIDRTTLLRVAQQAKQMQKNHAVHAIAASCEELAA